MGDFLNKKQTISGLYQVLENEELLKIRGGGDDDPPPDDDDDIVPPPPPPP